ncbi:hypothetical protein F5B18DRAFT_635390 [Nemania serpens]|nr:hypothetical protein F5B18DRAFT_635390 [Nemania serpens]
MICLIVSVHIYIPSHTIPLAHHHFADMAPRMSLEAALVTVVTQAVNAVDRDRAQAKAALKFLHEATRLALYDATPDPDTDSPGSSPSPGSSSTDGSSSTAVPAPQYTPSARDDSEEQESQAGNDPEESEHEDPHQGRLPCRHCPKQFNSKWVLKQHVDDRHVGMRCYWPGCGTTTPSETCMIRHFHRHQSHEIENGAEPTVCPWPGCGNRYSRRDSVQRCIKRHNSHAPRGQ